ncbi:hypothetical protein [Haladaptatus sp.]|uniref:hypothetical protein n=1 Tax=Haladaptatus sp. TaxID=1973141 RepID=UPI003C4F462D
MSSPIGVKILSMWAALVGGAMLVLAVIANPLYFPLSLGSLAAAYGLWNRRYWGLILEIVLMAIEGVRDIATDNVPGFVVVLLIFGYLYTQRRHFS